MLTDLISISSLSKDEIELILRCAELLEPFSGKGNKLDVCKGEILGLLFFEPSTRTEKSFQSAMYRLGGDVIVHKDAGSSREKGESKIDTIKVIEQYCDILVIRDTQLGSVSSYAGLSHIPVINAGDGAGEHPTQALLDLYTIKKEIGRLDNLRVVFTGDLKYGRTVHSLIKALRKFSGNMFYGTSPKPLGLSEELKGNDYEEIGIAELSQVQPDVIYATRIQKERLGYPASFSYEINNKILETLPSKTRIMHPLPRVDELNPEIDSDPRVVPFKQVRHGLTTRMAILALMLDHEKGLATLTQGLRM
jgi:aspartate carbamoyltransferase catalytic subunit